MRSRGNTAGLILLLALLAAGCSSESTSTTDAVITSDSTIEVDDAAATNKDASGEAPADDFADEFVAPDLDAPIVRTDDGDVRNDRFVSPVFDALGFDPNDREETEREYVVNAEELVRACMAEAGFEYVPDVPDFSPAVGPRQMRYLELSSRISSEQFTAEYGYGIATLTELDFEKELVDKFVQALFGPANDEVRTPAEQVAYEMALSGMTTQGRTPEQARNLVFGTNIFAGVTGSCRAHGYETADNVVRDRFDGLLSLIGDEYEALGDAVINDPRVRELTTTWQTCMAGHGYSYETPEDIQRELFASDQALRDRFLYSEEVLDLFALAQTDNLAGMDSEGRFNWLERNGAYRGHALVPTLQADLDELIVFELAVASQDEACADDSIYFEVLREYEQGFIEEHAGQIELILAGQR